MYALAVTLFECVALRPPFESADRLDLYQAILNAPPPNILKLNRAAGRDLRAVLEKALEKDKARRYQSPAELATDIRHYLDDEPIVARPASSMYQLRKFARRNKALVGGALGIVLALLLGTGGMAWKTYQASVARDDAEEARERAQTEAASLQAVNTIFSELVIAVAPDEGTAIGWNVEQDFVDSIRDHKPVELTSFEDGLHYMRITEAVTRSRQEGRAVSLEEV